MSLHSPERHDTDTRRQASAPWNSGALASASRLCDESTSVDRRRSPPTLRTWYDVPDPTSRPTTRCFSRPAQAHVFSRACPQWAWLAMRRAQTRPHGHPADAPRAAAPRRPRATTPPTQTARPRPLPTPSTNPTRPRPPTPTRRPPAAAAAPSSPSTSTSTSPCGATSGPRSGSGRARASTPSARPSSTRG